MSSAIGVDWRAAGQSVASGLATPHAAGLRTMASATVPGKAAAQTTPATGTSGTSGTTSTSSSASTAGQITSSDFLTLLVTEMQNQDPTAPTDPNAYIQQLVGVNSLQQLISINSELGTSTTGTSGTSGTTRPITLPPVSVPAEPLPSFMPASMSTTKINP